MIRGDDLCQWYRDIRPKPRCWDHGGKPQSIDLHRVGGESDVYAALIAMRTSYYGDSEAPPLPFSALVGQVSTSGASNGDLTFRAADLGSALLSPPGLLLHTRITSQQRKSSLLSAGHLAAIALAVPGPSLLVWVLNATTAAPLPHASVTLYGLGCCGASSNVERIAEAATDSAGVATFAPADVGGHERLELKLLVAAPGRSTTTTTTTSSSSSSSSSSSAREMLLLTDVPRPRTPSPPPPIARLLTDRAAYRLNDTLRVKGE